MSNTIDKSRERKTGGLKAKGRGWTRLCDEYREMRGEGEVNCSIDLEP